MSFSNMATNTSSDILLDSNINQTSEEDVILSVTDVHVKSDFDVENQGNLSTNENHLLNNNVSSNSSNSITFPVPRSKRQLKRERKQEYRKKMIAEWKLQRKIKNKVRKKQNKQQMTCVQKAKITPMANSSNKFSVVIDFSYDELMSTKDLMKCANQVVRCYSVNRRSSRPLKLHFCSFVGKIQEEMSKCYDFKKWDIHFSEDSYMDIFKKENLVYLTSESRNVLKNLEDDKVYIIGGLVDHNAHKGVSYRKAIHEGIAHAQLPIKEHIQMKTRSVLTINHVFEILLKVSNGESWTDSLRGAIPQRFLAQGVPSEPKTTTNEENTSQVENSNLMQSC